MSRSLWINPAVGVSGDMLLGALFDVGASEDFVIDSLSALEFDGWEIGIEKIVKNGILATRVEITCEDTSHHRSWSHIDSLIATSSLEGEIIDGARKTFKLLGEIEANRHGIDIEEVHFHEVGAIDSMFRVPNWELLYGEPDLKATVKQHGYSFEVDFGKVYWNSRLETEHKRLVDVAFKRGEVIVDAMAGVGPFVVPAVKTKGCRVYASDLNPDCFEMMQKNVKLNKMEDSVKLYNLDARAFIKSLLTPVRKNNGPEETWMQNISAYEEELKKFREKTANEGNDEKETDTKKIEKKRKRLEEKSVPKPKWSTTLIAGEDANTPPSGATFDHIIMNLPATAVEFLDCLKHSFDRATWSNRKLPTVHAYAFRPPGHTDQDVISRAEGHLGCPIKNAKVHEVRDVAPNKAMVCVSFQITEEQAFAP